MHWLLIGYMFLFIHRPFEFWPMLGEWHIERLYIIGLCVAWLCWPGKRWLPNRQHLAYGMFACAVFACWLTSPWAEHGQVVVENWFKVLVFYLLLTTCMSDAAGLRRLAAGFLVVMAIYMLHSLREYVGGRYTFRMGIPRLIGVDSSLGDPNSFGASIVFALPFARAFWLECRSGLARAALSAYWGLSVGCILLTGSRSSLLGLLVWAGWTIIRSRRRWVGIGAAVAAAPLIFVALPDFLQTRFETIINPEVGPVSARVSGEGRLEGLITGVELFLAYPLTGVGPGAWRPASGSKLESHNLYGQLAGELGLLGIMAFAFVVAAFLANLGAMQKLARRDPAGPDAFEYRIASAVAMGLFLLLFMGNFGHNLFRHNWLWFGAFLISAHFIASSRSKSRCLAPRTTPSTPRLIEWRVRVASPAGRG